MERTVPGALARAAELFGEHEAIADPDGPRLTYAQLHDSVRRVAGGLRALGFAKGDRLALWAPNTYQWVIVALATHWCGGTLVPINTRFTGPEAQDILDRARAKALVVTGGFLGVDRLASLERTPPITLTIPDQWDEVIQGPVDVEDVSPDEVSDILFTSGTTGRSKGAMSAHRQALGVAGAWAAIAGLVSSDRYLIINPFFHSFGYKAGILACLVSGATMVPQKVFDVGEAMRLVEKERITVLPGPPTIYQTMLDSGGGHDLSSLRLAVTGAATVPSVLIERMREGLGFDTVLTAYGLTEAVVATMCRPGDSVETIAQTSGRPAAGFEVRLGEHDEILLRGPNVMLGYLDDPIATEQAIDADGWLHTGDVGRLDEAGNLSITDRLKDMYICGGFNVYPAEVEQVIARLDGVAESVVIGVPDERLGEVGKAFVVPRPGHQLSTEDVAAHCKRSLANYKVPRHVEFRATLPRNASGKPLKRVLREEESA
ncbi:FadD3 family acyl-CoA ligase [Allorhizocola rhizosphaerae]|uniref:FadD3 family acyl-CoA ligase n=1 Tax=Allorhizocola rhizosphaerae TaxID=1872709 RepID=UPI000E3E2DEE|nr:FadD3 family acyl-CoA ligase [Allorhizocola rhizosphaerae]